MTNFFFKLNIFFPHFPNFWSKNIFPKNWALMHNFIRVSSTMGKFREISGSNSKKKSWQMPGGKDWQTLFHRVLPATTRELTTTTTIDWHLNVKDKKCDLGLIKNYCITVSMQKFSSIHKLIQQILGSHKLNDNNHFWPGHPKIIEKTFSFPVFAPAC